MPALARSAGVRLHVFWMAVIVCLILLEARAGLPWASIGPDGGEVVSLAIDPTASGTLYAGTFEGGVFKSVDGGVRWNAVNAGLTDGNVRSLAIDPITPQTLYAATFGGVFRSDNGGADWRAVNNGLADGSVLSLAIDPATPQTLYAGTGSGVFKSTNGGTSWSAVNNGLFPGVVWSLAIDPATPQTLYAGIFSCVFKSTNGGTSWSAVDNGLFFGDVRSLAVDPATPQTLYAGTFGSGVFKSTNGGASWNAVNSGLTDTDVLSLVIDPAAPQTLYAGTLPTTFGSMESGGVFKSTDGGAAWRAVRTGLADTNVWSLAIEAANPQTLYAGTRGGGVFRSDDGGVGWSAANAGLTNLDIFSLAIDAADPQTLYAGTDQGLFKSTDGGVSWSDTGLIFSPFSNTVESLAIDPADPRILYAGTQGSGVYKSTDGGASWEGTGLVTGLASDVVFSLAIDPTTPQTLYAGTSGGGVFKSTDGGAAWNAVNAGLTNGTVQSLAIDPTAPETLYAGTFGGVFKSSDGGAAWAVNAGLGQQFVYSLAIDPANPQTLYAATLVRGVLKSSDGGADWSAVNVGLTDLDVFSLAIDPSNPQTLYAGTRGGVFKSADGGAGWNAVHTGMGAPVIVSLAVDPASPENVYAGTVDQGAFKTLDIIASLGQAFAGPIDEGRAFTSIVLVNRDVTDCRAALAFSQGTSSGPAVALNGRSGNFLTMHLPSGAAERVVLTADALSQGIVSVFTLAPCINRSLRVSGSYLIEAADGSIQEAFTIQPNSDETWLTADRCSVISTFQDPQGKGGLAQNLGLAVSNHVEDREAPAGTRMDLTFFDAAGNPAGQESIPVTGSHTASFPLPDSLEGDLTTVFCLSAPADFAGAFDLTAVNVLQKNGFQFDSRLFAEVFEPGDESAWPAQQDQSRQLSSGGGQAIVASLGQAFAGPVGEDSAFTTITVTNRDLTDCEAALTFSHGAAAGPPVFLNGQPGNSLTIQIPSGGLHRVLLTADELAQGIVSLSVATPCTSDSLSLSGTYLVFGPDGAIKEAFTIRPNSEQTWLKAGRCAVITTIQDPQGDDDGLIQDLGLALSSVTPGQEAPAGTGLDLFFFDAKGEPLGHESIAVSGVHATGFPLPASLKGIVTTVFCLDSEPEFAGAIDLTAINLVQKGSFQFDSRLFVDVFESGDDSAWSQHLP